MNSANNSSNQHHKTSEQPTTTSYTLSLAQNSF